MNSQDSNEFFGDLEQKHRQWTEEQNKLLSQVIIPQDRGYFPQIGDVVLALDIQYKGDDAHVAGNLFQWQGEEIGTFAGVARVDAPYIPSFFCFREGPPLLAFVRTLEKKAIPSPHLIIVDGHGIAHPRRFGVACWMGIATGRPAIGCAKETLLPYHGDLDPERGSFIEVFLEDQGLPSSRSGAETQRIVGYVLRNQNGVNPIFTSPGHLVSLKDCVPIVLGLPGAYRVPDPLRKADHAAREHCKGVAGKDFTDFGKLEQP